MLRRSWSLCASFALWASTARTLSACRVAGVAFCANCLLASRLSALVLYATVLGTCVRGRAIAGCVVRGRVPAKFAACVIAYSLRDSSLVIVILALVSLSHGSGSVCGAGPAASASTCLICGIGPAAATASAIVAKCAISVAAFGPSSSAAALTIVTRPSASAIVDAAIRTADASCAKVASFGALGATVESCASALAWLANS